MNREPTIALVCDAGSRDAALLTRGIATVLRYVGLPHTSVACTDAAKGALRAYRVAVVPCSTAEFPTAAIVDFVRRGGKMLLGLDPAPELLALLELKRVKLKPVAVREMSFPHKTLHGLPARVFLSTRQVALFKAGPGVKSLAQWRTLDDLSMQDPAAYLAPHGALLTTAVPMPGEHTQFSEDRVHLGRLIAALVNHFHGRFDLLQFQRRLTEQLSDEEELLRDTPPREFEVRGLWLPHVPTPNECALIARQNFNLICPSVGAVAARHYERSTFHRPWMLAEALTKCVDQAHRSGLEVLPSVTAWPLPTPDLARFFDGTGRLAKNLKSQIPNLKSHWMCPTHPENQQLLLHSITRLLEEFAPDGVLLGGLRFPDETSCRCDGCRTRFEEHLAARIGARILNQQQRQSLWQNWRCEVMTDLLKRLLTACRATNPNARLAIATLPSWDRLPKSLGQDPSLWQQQHLADIVVPMDFTDSMPVLRDELGHQLSSRHGGTRICAGIGAYTDASELASVADLVRQIRLAREMEADGFVIYHTRPELWQEQMFEGLRAGALRSPAKLPWHPNAPIRSTKEAAAPGKPPRHRISPPPWSPFVNEG
jgi:uncharacterized lipoprotein YddW (UPF0748 family)